MGHAALFPTRLDEGAGRSGDLAQVSAELHLFRWAADCIQDGLVVPSQPAEPGPPSVLYANPAFTALSGLTLGDLARLRADSPQSGAWPSQDDPLWRSLRESHQGDDVFSADVVLCGGDGDRTVLHLRSQPIRDQSGQVAHRVAVVRDVTDQANLEEVSRRNERLACIGLLAAGIAHEINNPTGSALLAAETALAVMDSPQAGPQVAACLRNIVTSLDRCGRIVRTLLRYSREEPSEKQACSINDVAQQAMELARPYAERHGAELRLELDPDVPLTPMNPLEIELALVNLVRNAVEAGTGKGDRSNLCDDQRCASVPASGPFRQTGPVPFSRAGGGSGVVLIRTQRTDDGVRVAVGDTGCGMSKEHLSHVFDPLYTTRRQLGGSGLGMGIVYGIVQGHGGRMEVQSQPDMGTTVTIDLPVPSGEERPWPES